MKATIADQLLEYQQNNCFEDTVLRFCTLVHKEIVLSGYKDTIYKSMWLFNDGSQLNLEDELFKK